MNLALRRTEETPDTLPCALLSFDAGGRVRDVNARLLAMVGRKSRQVLGCRLDSLLSAGSAMFLHTYVLPLLQGHGQADEIVMDLLHADGSERPVLISARRDGTGADARVQFALLPAPRRKDTDFDQLRARRETEHTRRHLERAIADLDGFAARAAHDLSEPARKVRAFGDRLLQSQRSQLHPDDRDYVQRMLAAAERMQAMIDGLQELAGTSQIRDGQPRLPLAGVVTQALARAERHIVAAGAEVVVAELPELEVNAVAVGEVLQHLLCNAIKFRREDVVARLHIDGGWDDTADLPTWWLRLRDNGTGFAPEHATRVFDPFMRLHDKFQYPGAGLGLAISQRLAQGLGGRLHAEGRCKEGASFTLTLPA